MENDKSNEKLLPKLRFSGFDAEWVWEYLMNLSEISTGNKDLKDNVKNGEYPFFVRSANVEHIDTYSYDGEAVLIPGDGVNVGKIYHYINGKFDYHQRVYKISDFNHNILGKYVYYYMSQKFLKEVHKNSQKASVDSLRLPTIQKMKIKFPSNLNEQHRIISLLSAVDYKIELLKNKYDFYHEFKKYLMQQIFAQKLRFDFDDEWLSVKLKDIAKVTGGKRMPKGSSLINEPNNHPYITVSNMNNDFEDLSTYQYVPAEIYPQIKNYIVDYNDLIISVAGTLGLVKKVPKCLDKANLTENANRISEIKINIDYLQYYLNTTMIQNRISAVQTNNAQPKLALKEIRNFKIQYPSKEEQVKIVNLMSSVDKKISSIDNNLKNMQEFKKGLLQQMFV